MNMHYVVSELSFDELVSLLTFDYLDIVNNIILTNIANYPINCIIKARGRQPCYTTYTLLY